MLHTLGPEFSILREVPTEDIARAAGPCVAEGIRRLRLGQVKRQAGFDGEYGTITLLTPAEIEQFSGQISLFGPAAPAAGPGKRRMAPVLPASAPQPTQAPLPEQLTLYGQSAALHPYQLEHLVLCNLILFPIQDTNLENGAVRRGF